MRIVGLISTILAWSLTPASSRLDSETVLTEMENIKDHGGLLEDEYNAIDFAAIPEQRFVQEDDHFLPEDMLSIELLREQKCFFQDVSQVPVEIKGAWFVSTSGSTTVEVTVKRINPNSEKSNGEASELVLFQDVSDDSGGFTVDGSEIATYAFCFHSVDPSSEKILTFSVDVSSKVLQQSKSSALKDDENKHHIYPLQGSASRLLQTMRSLHQELEVVLLRFERHMATQDVVEGRVDFFTFLETSAILIVTLGQIYYVRRLVNRSKQWV